MIPVPALVDSGGANPWMIAIADALIGPTSHPSLEREQPLPRA